MKKSVKDQRFPRDKSLKGISGEFLSTAGKCGKNEEKLNSSGLLSFLLLAVLLFAGSLVHAQEQEDSLVVRGVVLSPSNDPLPDVSLSIEGSSAFPVVTNEKGEFTLTAPSGNEYIIISPTGNYKSKRIFLNQRANLTVYLTPEDIPSGYDPVSILSQQVNKRNIVSSYYDLNTDRIYHTPALSIDEYMQGRVPGMHVINRSGIPGSGAVTTLRGVNSLYTGNQPFYIVDGIPLLSHGIFGSNLDGYEYNPLSTINPFDISKTTIYKDPSITSSYGSRGSNGIIVIETLDPSVTETSIELDMRGGYSFAPDNLIPQLNAGQHKTLVSEVLFSTGVEEEVIREAFENLYLTPDDERYIDYQHNTNWQSLIFDDAYMTNMNIKVKGGDEIARYGLSFGYLNADGIIKSTNHQGYKLRFVSRLNIFTWLKMNAGVSLNYNTSALKEAGTVSQTSPVMSALAKSPMLNPYRYDINKKEMDELAPVDELGVSNPLATVAPNGFEATNSNYNFNSTIGFDASLNKNLNLMSNFSLAYNVLKEHIFMPNQGMELYYDSEAWNVAKLTNNDITSFYNNTFLTYSNTFSKDHRFISNTGMRIYLNTYEFDWGLTKNAHQNDQYRMIQDGQNNLREIGGAKRVYNWLSFYEYLNYTYRDKYIVTGSVSLDGSSRVGDEASNTSDIAGEPFGIFYSGGLAWRISSESFLKNLSWLEEMKLRFSMGKTGNDDIGESSATNYYNAVKFRETVGLYPAVLPNKGLTYEMVTQMNTGFDISLWGNRFSATADFFRSTTEDMLVYRPVDSYLGYDIRVENGGKMENMGWEFNTYLRLVNAANFKWEVNFNVSSFNSEILQMDYTDNEDIEAEADQLVTDIQGAQIVNREGEAANSFYGYIYKGVYASQQEAAAAGLVNDRLMPYQAGDAIYEDISGPEGTPDGIINSYDKTIIGNPTPEYFGGFYNAFSYKNITLSALLHFVYDNEVFNYVRYVNERMTGLENQSATVLNRWQHEGQETDVPRAFYGDPVGNSDFSTRWIEDGSFMRIKNITLSYRIPREFLSFKNAEFYVSANNLFVLTDYLGYDPEFGFSYSQIHQGVDYGQAPHPRQFIAGIKIGL